MAITLTYNAQTSVPVEIEGFTPDWACDKSVAEIERFEIFHGNRRISMAEMFTVTGDASDREINFEGNLSGVHWIGAHMTSGVVRIHGPAGRHIGSQMSGGEIIVILTAQPVLQTEGQASEQRRGMTGRDLLVARGAPL